MSRDQRPFQRPPRPEPYEFEEARRRHANPLIIFGISLLAVAAVYLSLVIVPRAIALFFPGNAPNLGIASVLPGVPKADPKAAATIDERINILFMGLDQRRDQQDDAPYRTDSVVIFTIDPYAKTAGAFSIPRDTLAEIPNGAFCGGGKPCGYVTDRINVAYEMGQYNYDNYPGGGPGLLKDTIKHTFGIPIDNYIILNFNAFIDIIDELGGIDIDIPEYAYDPAYADCQFCSDVYPVEFLPGERLHMDGVTALTYARIRKSDDDFKRIERQQLVMRAAAEKAMSLGLFDIGKAADLYVKDKKAGRADIANTRIPGLALLAKQIGVENIQMVSAAPATYSCNYCPGAVLLWDREKMAELEAQVFSDSRLQGENAAVKVLNGTRTPELADQFASFLRRQGVSSGKITVDDYAGGQLYNSTLIVDLSGKSYTVQKLAEWLDLPSTRVVTGTDPRAGPFADPLANVVIVLGSDFRLPVAMSMDGSSLADVSAYGAAGPSSGGQVDYSSPTETETPTPEPTSEATAPPASPPQPPAATNKPAPTAGPSPSLPPDATATAGG